jgi:hypothetical protein
MTIWNLAGTTPKLLPQLYNYFLCYPILLYNLLISPNHRTLRSRGTLNIVFLNDDQILRC